jgi:hypothetical protein
MFGIVMKRSSLQYRVRKFMPKRSYEIDTSGLYYKSFTIIIYKCNDSSQYYNTLITNVNYTPNLTLALASVVNYDHK